METLPSVRGRRFNAIENKAVPTRTYICCNYHSFQHLAQHYCFKTEEELLIMKLDKNQLIDS